MYPESWTHCYKSLIFSNNMIKLSKSPFDNKRLDLAPSFIVEELLGFQFT